MTLGTRNSPVLSGYMASRSEVTFIMGPLASGKTIGTLQKLLKLMTEQRPNRDGKRLTRWLAVRNTYPDLMTTTVKDFRAFFTEPDFGHFKQGGLEPPRYLVRFALPDGTRVESEVIFLAMDREDAADKIRGFQLTGGWLNEIKELVKPVVDMVHGRCNRYPNMVDGGVMPSWSGMIGDTNAPDTDSWYCELAEITKPEGWEFFRQPGAVRRTGAVDPRGEPIWEVNPDAENLELLAPNYYHNLLRGKSTSWIQTNLANEYGFHIEGDAVHKNYVDSVHCPGEIPYQKGYPLIFGFDFGRTPACVAVMIEPVTGRKMVIDELCAESMSAALFGPEVKRWIKERFPNAPIMGMFGDPAGDQRGQNNESTPFTILHAQGLPVQPASTNAISARRAAVSVPLRENCFDARPRLLVSARCKMVRKGLQGGFCYRKLKTTGDRYAEAPEKNRYSHPVEALEYALLGAGEYHEAIRTKDPFGNAVRNASYLAIVE